MSDCRWLTLQFMLIFWYAQNGTLEIEGLKTIAATCNVAEEGVQGTKNFSEAKVKVSYSHT